MGTEEIDAIIRRGQGTWPEAREALADDLVTLVGEHLARRLGGSLDAIEWTDDELVGVEISLIGPDAVMADARGWAQSRWGAAINVATLAGCYDPMGCDRTRG